MRFCRLQSSKRHLIVILLLPKWKEDNLLCSKVESQQSGKCSVNAKKIFRNNVLYKKMITFAQISTHLTEKNEQLFNDIQSF